MSKPYDATLKELLERAPEDWLRLAGFPVAPCELVDADVSTVTAASDKVLLVRDSPPWLCDLNFQRGPDASLPRRMHLYSVVLGGRHELEVRSVAVLLAREANLAVINGVYCRQFPGEEPYDVFRYHVIRVWELPVEPLLTGGLGTLPLAPISNVAEADLPGVIERIKQRLKGPRAPKWKDRLWTGIYVLMGLRYHRSVVNRLLQGVTEMEESDTYQAIIEKGELKEARKLLRRVGRKQLGEPSTRVSVALDALTNLEQIEHLIERVAGRANGVNSWEDLLGLSKPSPRRRKKST
jgi:predicted transposase YdaD